jgi:hypothetical protein
VICLGSAAAPPFGITLVFRLLVVLACALVFLHKLVTLGELHNHPKFGRFVRKLPSRLTGA